MKDFILADLLCIIVANLPYGGSCNIVLSLKKEMGGEGVVEGRKVLKSLSTDTNCWLAIISVLFLSVA